MRDDDYDAHMADERRSQWKMIPSPASEKCARACDDCRRCVEKMKLDVMVMEQVRKGSAL